jgi:tetratricopeptide (TPR) repeat protein
MENETKNKLKVVLVAFIILMIPFGFILKIMHGIYLNDKAMDNYYGAHIGYSDIEAAKQSISDLEKAKKFYRSNYVIYYNQAILYGHLKQYDKAVEIFENLNEIKPDYIEGYLYQGMFQELNDENERANRSYLKYNKLRSKRYKKEKLTTLELKNFKIAELLDYYFLKDTISFTEKLIELEEKYQSMAKELLQNINN